MALGTKWEARPGARAGLFMLAAGIFAAAGCGDKDGDSGDDGAGGEELEGGGGTTECGGEAPVIVSMSCENMGLQASDSGDYPMLRMSLEVTDADGDLDSYTAEIYFDETIDGSVLADSSPFDPVAGTTSEAVCNTTSADLNLGMLSTGGNPAFDTEYEWSVIVSDAAGLASAPFVLTCFTPKADGTDGG